MQESDRSMALSRRHVLKLGSALPGTKLVAGFSPPAQEPDGQPPYGMRTTGAVIVNRTVGSPPLPPLEVIALNRMTFGFSAQARSEYRALGSDAETRFAAFVEQQLNPSTLDDTEAINRLNAAGFTTLNKSLTQLWSDHVLNDQGWSNRMLPITETEKATFLRAVYSKRQMFELLADFWHNHFNVYGWHYYVGPVFVHYDRDVIRAHALGNFRQMLEGVARSTAMLYYLDNYINQAGGFNENFARELIELHTMGAENYLGTGNPFDVPLDEEGEPVGYVDNDVYEAARCFTGWRVDYSTWETGVGQSGGFLYYPAWHDRANKFFLQRYFPSDQADMKDGRDVLDALAAHPGTARHIARKLCRRFVSDTPSEDLVNMAAQVFRENRNASDQIRRTLRVILLSSEFRDTWGDKLKRPFEVVMSMLRATRAEFNPSDSFGWYFDNIGQPLFSRTPPDGYPDLKVAWSGTTSYVQRWRMSNVLVEDWIDGATIDTLSQMPAHLKTPNQIVDYWIDSLLGRPLHPLENRTELVNFIAQGRNPDYDLTSEQISDRLPRLVSLILMTPDFNYR